MMPPLVAHGAYAIRRMLDTAADYAQMAAWLTDPRVLEFYEGRDNPMPVARIREKYAPRVLSNEGVTPCILLYEGVPLGYMQFYPAEDAEYAFGGQGKIYALDMFLGVPEAWGKGHGTRFLHLLLGYVFETLAADWVLIDPHVDNARALRAYEKCGFTRVKVLPAHEAHEGSLVDCWLMAMARGAFQPDAGEALNTS